MHTFAIASFIRSRCCSILANLRTANFPSLSFSLNFCTLMHRLSNVGSFSRFAASRTSFHSINFIFFLDCCDIAEADCRKESNTRYQYLLSRGGRHSYLMSSSSNTLIFSLQPYRMHIPCGVYVPSLYTKCYLLQ